MPEKCPKNARKMPEKCPKNAREMPEDPRKPARTHKTAETHNFWGHGRKFRSKNLGCIFRTKNHDSAKNATEALHSIGLTHISTCFKNTKKGRTGFGFRKVPECRRIAFEIVAKGGPLPRIPAQRLRVTPSQTPITPQI